MKPPSPMPNRRPGAIGASSGLRTALPLPDRFSTNQVEDRQEPPSWSIPLQ
ncbi:hypothetical protein [Sporichthya brevicatena]|uniref:hypothetical protein n=1 Tax=Sporichthya brevicatena TaxID=171442 RepID=UPI0031D330B0